MNSKNSSFQNVIYLRFTLVFNVYVREAGIIEGYNRYFLLLYASTHIFSTLVCLVQFVHI